MNYKKFIPCIYLLKGNAVRSFRDSTVINMNPSELAKFYSDNHADEIIVFDLSTDDLDHEEAIGMIKHICIMSEVPIIGAGNVNRMEDVKKLIYAGCKKAVLNFSRQDNIKLTQEVSKKFGKEKIIAAISDIATFKQYQDIIQEYISEVLLVNENNLKEFIKVGNIPMISMIPEVSLDKMMEYLNFPSISGITGEIINSNAKEINSLKHLCSENGITVHNFDNATKWSEFKLNSDGMIPVIVQDYITSDVLMVAYMNEEAYQQTLKSGKMTYYSRSREELWLKGDTSGHYQYVKSLTADCDMDTILAKVSQVGAACHTGSYSCFFNEIVKKEYEETNPLKVFESVFAVIKDRKIHPKDGSYTNYLFDKGIDKILKKLGEEATEIVIASKNPNSDEIKYEISDFLYHMMVLMVEKGVSWEEITTELANR